MAIVKLGNSIPLCNGAAIEVTSANPPRLPDAYQEVEYLEVDGAVRFDLGFKGNQTLIAVLDLESIVEVTDSLQHIFGDAATSSAAISWNIAKTGNNKSRFGSAATTSHLGGAGYPGRRVFTISATGYFIGSTNYWTPSASTFETTNNVFLIGTATATAGKNFIGRYRTSTVTINNITHTYIPCYRVADNVAGVYDLYSNTFLTNTMNGTIIIGGDI